MSRVRQEGAGNRAPAQVGRGGQLKVLIGFTLSDLYAESFTFKNGDKAGETGVSLKARLLGIAWAKVDGQPFLPRKRTLRKIHNRPGNSLPGHLPTHRGIIPRGSGLPSIRGDQL